MHPSGKGTDTSYSSPIFNSYFNTNLAEIAARVTTEFSDGDGSDDFNNIHSEDQRNNGGEDPEIGCEDDGGGDDDFEFDLSYLMPEKGEIRPVYPVFNRDLLKDLYLVGEIESRPSDREEDCSRAQVQLKNLFLEDRDLDPPSSSSSSEADELEENEIPPGTYCVWEANKSPEASASPSPGRCTKSNSTGSSASVAGKAKAWKLRNFLKRSKSDGKEGLLLLSPKKKVKSSAAASSSGGGGKQVRVRTGKAVAAREGYYGGACSREGGENKRRSYLPYKQDLGGLFTSPQGLRKMHLRPL